MQRAQNVVLRGVTARCVLVTHPRAKRVRVVVLPTGIVRITKPVRVSIKQALSFAEDNREWIMDRYKDIEGSIVLPEDSRERFLKYKEEAREIITAKVELWNKLYKFEYGDIRIKNTRTMWGSCSSKGNLNFNYKLIFLPEELLDYVVVHELCHLREMNHSKRFWDLVAIALDDYRDRRKELRTHSQC